MVKGLSRALLGRPAIKSLCLVCRVNTVQTSKDVWHKFPRLLKGLGKLEGEYSIKLMDNAKPYALTGPSWTSKAVSLLCS